MADNDLTRAAEILGGKRGTNPLSQGVPWDSGTRRDSNTAAAREPAPMLDSTVPSDDGTTRTNVFVPCPAPPLGAGQWDAQDGGLPIEVEQRLANLVAIGAIDHEDAALVRRRWHVYPSEWSFLLDCCEAARTGAPIDSINSPGRRSAAEKGQR